jgi:hypothetical protein
VPDYSLVFPEGFDDYAWEVESKGWFGDARLAFMGRSYRMNFYEPVRLAQEIEDELKRGRPFFEPNLVVVPSVTRQHMEAAVEFLVEYGQLRSLVTE